MSTQLLRGRVQNLRKTRCSQDFFFTRENSAKMGATAIAAGLLGLGGIATGLSATAIDTTEEADLLEFELDGKSVRAWVWLSVFDEGDEVEVVAEQWGDVWQGFGIRRVSDRGSPSSLQPGAICSLSGVALVVDEGYGAVAPDRLHFIVFCWFLEVNVSSGLGENSSCRIAGIFDRCSFVRINSL